MKSHLFNDVYRIPCISRILLLPMGPIVVSDHVGEALEPNAVTHSAVISACERDGSFGGKGRRADLGLNCSRSIGSQ